LQIYDLIFPISVALGSNDFFAIFMIIDFVSGFLQANNYVLCRFRKNCTHLPVSKNIVPQEKPRKTVVPVPVGITIPVSYLLLLLLIFFWRELINL